MSTAIETTGAGHRYGDFWALRDCSLSLPEGSITAIVGPNGAGKTTLLNMIVGLLPASEGELRVVGVQPSSHPDFLAQVGFLAQDSPLYKEFSVADLLRFGRAMNPAWDDALARERLAAAEVPLNRRAGKLSGGQRAQLALTLAVAKHPELLILDEPVASLDPLARREFLQTLMEATAEHELSVILSSHVVADLERVCDYLIVLIGSRVHVAGEVDVLLASHHLLTGPRRDPASLPGDWQVISASHTDRQSTLLVRADGPILDPAWPVEQVSLEDLVLAYMSQSAGTRRRSRPVLEVQK